MSDPTDGANSRADGWRGPIRVSMIGSRGFPGQRAGAERVLESVCPRLVAQGDVDVRVYCPQWLEYGEPSYRGVTLTRVGGLRTKYGDTFTRSLLATLHELRSGGDVVHYHSIGSAPLALLPRLAGKRVVVTVHALDWQRSKWNGVGKWYLRFAEWASLRFPHRTVAVSEALRDDLQARHGRPVTYIANGAEPRHHRAVDDIAQFGLEANKYVLFVGRLVPEKGTHLLIEAFRRLPPELGLKLAIAGPAWYESDYDRRLRQLADGDDRVVFLGEADDDRLAELYSNCAAYVLPSDVEGMSLSLLDALAYGAPIVTSSIPPNADLVGEAGAIFEAGNADALHDALHEVLTEPILAEKLRAAALARAGGDFDWDRIAPQWATVYHDLCGG